MQKILINLDPYKVNANFISGSEIKKIGGIPAYQKVYFHPSGSMKGIEIADNDSVDLTRPGAENFVSK